QYLHRPRVPSSTDYSTNIVATLRLRSQATPTSRARAFRAAPGAIQAESPIGWHEHAFPTGSRDENREPVADLPPPKRDLLHELLRTGRRQTPTCEAEVQRPQSRY